MEQGAAAQAGLPLSVLPQDQQVVRGAGDQAALPEAHKHLTKRRKTTGSSQRRQVQRERKRSRQSHLDRPRVSDQIARQLQRPDARGLRRLLGRDAGRFVRAAEGPHSKEPWRGGTERESDQGLDVPKNVVRRKQVTHQEKGISAVGKHLTNLNIDPDVNAFSVSDTMRKTPSVLTG